MAKHSQETKDKISKTLKDGYKDGRLKVSDDTKKKISNKLIGEKNYFYGKTHTEETKRKISLSLKKSMNVLDTLKKLQIARLAPNFGMRGKHHSEETKKKMSESRQGWKYINGFTEEHRKHLSDALRGRRFSEEHIENLKKNNAHALLGKKSNKKGKTNEELYGHLKSEEIKDKIKFARSKQVFPINNSSIELKIQKYLSDLHIEFVTHKYMSEISHKYQCDIFIPVQDRITQKTIIECDGCFFHCCSICKNKEYSWTLERRRLDELRTKELIDKGFKVIRLWEHEINKMKLNNFKERLINSQ